VIKSFLINLDRSPDRLQFFSDQAREYGLPFERISAVDGRSMSQADYEQSVSKAFEFQPITLFEAAVFLSHRSIWQRVVDQKLLCAAVFEDDVVLSPEVRTFFLHAESIIESIDLLKLETTLRKVVCEKHSLPNETAHSIQRLRTWHGGAAGYIVSNRGARLLLNATKLLADQVDQVMFNPLSSISSQLHIYQCIPALCVQKDLQDRNKTAVFASTIERSKTRGKLFRHGPLIDLNRLLKKQRERLRRHWLARQPTNEEIIVSFDGPWKRQICAADVAA
jgi:glycosyl transferase, family 25